jgi:hypothetical protein
MKNPLRSEAAAFQFLLGAAVYFGLIAIAGVINAWAGLVVFIVLTLLVIGWWFRARSMEAQTKTLPVHRGGPGERRILVIANETVGGGPLREQVEQLSKGYDTKVLVVTPALNSRVRTITSDVDPAREQAQQRLDASLARLRDDGIDARGEVGDGDPLQAIEDALRTFGADQIVISTHPEGRSHWLERGVVDKAKERFAVPITHVVVDLEAER